jgi:WD40 repeat protein
MSVRLWRLGDGAVLRVFSGHSGKVSSLALSRDGQVLVSGASDATVRLWKTP